MQFDLPQPTPVLKVLLGDCEPYLLAKISLFGLSAHTLTGAISTQINWWVCSTFCGYYS